MRLLRPEDQFLRQGGLCLASLLMFALASLAAAAGKAAPAEDRESSAAYWRLPATGHGFAYHCKVSMKSSYIDATEGKIYSRAISLGILTKADGRRYSTGDFGVMRQVHFDTTAEKAERLCRGIRRIGKVSKYSSKKVVTAGDIAEIEKKAGRISDELSANKDVLDKLPKTKELLTELLAQYRRYIGHSKIVLRSGIVLIDIAAAREE